MPPPKSRWADEDPETEAIVARQKREKEDRKRAKAEKQRKQTEQPPDAKDTTDTAPPAKRRRLSSSPTSQPQSSQSHATATSTLLRFPPQTWGPCRHVDNFERLNHIEEGSYGLVSRAKDITTGEVVALKKLKMDNSPDGFPVTGLREIQTLLESRHANVVHLREIVIGQKLDE